MSRVTDIFIDSACSLIMNMKRQNHIIDGIHVNEHLFKMLQRMTISKSERVLLLGIPIFGLDIVPIDEFWICNTNIKYNF